MKVRISPSVQVAIVSGLFALLGTRMEMNHSDTKSSVDSVKLNMRSAWEQRHIRDSLDKAKSDSITWAKIDALKGKRHAR